MKIESAPNGDLHLLVEAPIEWMLLLSSLSDAAREGFDLADKVGAPRDDAGEWEDWHEWVRPDLHEAFATDRRVVEAALLVGKNKWFNCPHTLTIERADFYSWFAVLNQARLALEARWDFAKRRALLGDLVAADEEPDETDEDDEDDETAAMDDEEYLAASLRERLYSFIQQHLLDRGLG